MELERFCIKFPARSQTDFDETKLIEIFHEWIRLQKLTGTLLDVADYRHVPNGPGVMLITHEVNYAMDHADGLGLYAQRKLGDGETQKERILNLARSTAEFGALLESDLRVSGSLSLDASQFLYMSNDRLQAPNTDAAFEELKPDLIAAAQELYPGQQVSVTRLNNDPRDRLTVVVKVENSAAQVNMATLAAIA